ncbi:MAG: peptide deformylase [Patescibacteria group bacterium]
MNDNLKQKIRIFQNILNKIPEFRYIGDPILRKRTKKVSLSEGIKIGNKLGKVLIKYRKIAGFGRGLAAPQIGIDKSVFVSFVDDKLQIFINPVITKVSKTKNYFRELCLSTGFIWGDVKRSEWMELKWTNEAGKLQKQKFDSFMARLIQHEYAHLLGETNLDAAENKTIEFAKNPLEEKLRR